MSQKLERFIEQNRDAFNDQVPSPAVLSRIEARIADEKNPVEEKKGVLIPFRTLRWASAACLIVLVGTLAFWMGRQYDRSEQEAITANNNTPASVQENTIQHNAEAPAVASNTIQASTPVNNTHEQRKEAIFARLGNMESASTRMGAAMQAYNLRNPDKEIVDALVTSMNSDPNTNVRLAALEALARFHKERYVKQQLIRSLKKQKDPLVQIELIQLLTRMKETTILDQLQQIVDDEHTMEAVKEKAYSSILTLGS